MRFYEGTLMFTAVMFIVAIVQLRVKLICLSLLVELKET